MHILHPIRQLPKPFLFAVIAEPVLIVGWHFIVFHPNTLGVIPFFHAIARLIGALNHCATVVLFVASRAAVAVYRDIVGWDFFCDRIFD